MTNRRVAGGLAVCLCAVFGSGTRAFAQAQMAVDGAMPPATRSVAAGTVVSVAMSDGPANATDWIGLYATGAADGTYLDWRYLNGTTAAPAVAQANATVTFALSDGGGTIHTNAQITGKAASMGEGVVVGVLDALITDFSGKLAEI